jgi:hypothetical protein
VTAPYRNELETLEAKKRVLEAELSSIDERIKERRRLPLLDQVRVASPCPAKWDDMVGDERKRSCLSCDKSVFNITALTRDQAEQFLLENAGAEVCVRYYQRADGTIMTSDCSVGVTKKQRKKLVLAVAGAGAMAFGAMTALMQRERHVMGATAIPIAHVDPPPTNTVEVGPPTPSADPGVWMGGAVAIPDPPEPRRPEPPRPVQPRNPIRYIR